ncbi:MAG TPA: 2-oxoglutarate dehydrogenase complex dihydrolipoyllysine-residue succinyltransferase, partial [Isosphaeraceae bacterium]|nr:2-oxoglutarate dehydrogenase complex dihydrolipoyllysine-residue succinyltransferase [Isosphaeraceae bacterium]
MAAAPITVPAVGESIAEGILSRWIAQDGSAVKAGDPLFELETDKASTVVPASAAGTLKVSVPEGTTVAIGSTVGTLDAAAAPSAKAESKAPSPAPAESKAPPTAPAPAPSGRESAATVTEASVELAPSVRRIVAENNVDASQIEGTGRGGRLTKGDVLAHIEAPKPAAPPAPASPQATAPAPSADGQRETRKRMSGLRQTIAQRLVEVQHTAAILTTFNEADMSRVMDLRAKYKEPFQKKHGVPLGFMSFFVKAVVEAIRAFPAVNARVDGQDIVYHNYVNIGVAVSTERGLMVPVLRDADRMTFAEIEKGIAAYATKAREGTIAIPDLQAGTFTITNGGVFGSLLSTPILNPPQSGILGMHSIQKRPVAVGDAVVVRPMMYLALSYDHRIVDGREAVSFLV